MIDLARSRPGRHAVARCLALALAAAALSSGTLAAAQEVVAAPNPDADRLADVVRRLGSAPRDLSALIDARQPDCWISGHTHHAVDTRLGVTRLVSNPHGYRGECRDSFDPALVIEIPLAPGDRLFIASDGLTEAENRRGEPLADEGLQAILRTNAMLHGSALLESICWSASNYAEGKRNDDVSAVLIEHLPARGTGE